MKPTREQGLGGLVGLLVGDALGVPYEFHAPESLPPLERIEMDAPAGFHRAHAGTPPGTWSDDGAQALVLLASLLERDALDLDHFAAGLVAWLREGYMAVGGRVFDVGSQTGRALAALERGTPPERAGPAEEQANGNGSLMRVLPLALWHTGPDEALVEDARRQSLVTHGHLRSQLCCALYCLWARHLLAGEGEAWERAANALREMYPSGTAERAELDRRVLPPREPKGTGYVLDTLHSARWALESGDSYEEVARLAVSLGNDTDTTACVAGGLAGIIYGLDGIPPRWREALRGQELLDPLIASLAERHGWRDESV